MTDLITIIHGDCRVKLAEITAGSIQCVTTSPPYWGLRSYLPKNHPDKHLEIGQEKIPDCLAWARGESPCGQCYVCTLRTIFGGKNNHIGLWRVLRDDGTIFLNLGDTYAGGGNGGGGSFANNGIRDAEAGTDKNVPSRKGTRGVTVKSKRIARGSGRWGGGSISAPGFKAKDLIGIPWRVALALQADGWYLRSDIIWAKRNCMPESVTDRPTRSHEYIFLLSKSPKYFYDHEAIKEPCIYDVDGTVTEARRARARESLKSFPTTERAGIRNGGYKNSVNFTGKNCRNEKQRGAARPHRGFNEKWDLMTLKEQCTGMRNKRDVWTIAPANYPEAHFATFPPALVTPCILVGTSAKGCCPDCGAPWERILETESKWEERKKNGEPMRYGEQNTVPDLRGKIGISETSGWLPSCDCYGIKITKLPDCPDDAIAPEKCENCNGEGLLAALPLFPERITCPECLGSKGTPANESCLKWQDEFGIATAARLKLLRQISKKQLATVPCTVLDPFGGSGTVGQVALEHGRRAILIDLNADYIPLMRQRTTNLTPGLALA